MNVESPLVSERGVEDDVVYGREIENAFGHGEMTAVIFGH